MAGLLSVGIALYSQNLRSAETNLLRRGGLLTDYPRDQEYEVNISTNIVTPHIPWYCAVKKPVKALFVIAPHDERTVVEIAQRMPLDFEVVSMITYAHMRYPGKWTSKKAFNDLGGRLSRHNFDVIVIAKGDMDRVFSEMPDPIISQIKARLASGTGLVYAGQLSKNTDPLSFLPFYSSPFGKVSDDMVNNEHYVAVGFDGMRFDRAQMPKVSGSGSIVVAKNGLMVGVKDGQGEGRAVQICWPTSNYLLPDNDPFPSMVQREQAYYALCRAIAWTAKRELDFPFIPMGVNNGSLVAENTEEIGIIDDFTGERVKPVAGVHEKAGITRSTFGGLAPGDYLAFSVNGVKAGMTRFAVPEKAEKIEDIMIGQRPAPHVKTGKMMQGCIRLSEEAAQSADSLSLNLDFYDGYGRLVDRQIIKVTGGEIAFEHPSIRELAPGCFMTAALHNEDKILSRKKKDYIVWFDRQWDDYEVIICCLSSMINHPHRSLLLDSFRKMGATAVGPFGDGSNRKAFRDAEFMLYLKKGMHVYPRDSHYSLNSTVENTAEDGRMYEKTLDKRYLIRKPVITDPAYRKELKKDFQQTIKEWLPYHFWGYCLGDEARFNRRELRTYDFCFADRTICEMREWLKKEYVSLEKLNKTWGTDFGKWIDVIPMTTKEVLARDGKLGYAPWADHRSYIDTLAADWYGWMRNLAHEIDPELKIGTSGTQAAAAYSGLDYAKLTPNWDYLQNYSHINHHDFIRSFASIPTAGWNGYCRHGKAARWQTWLQLINGGSGVSFWHGTLFCNYDGTLNRCGVDYKDHLWELRHGLGKLLVKLNKDIPPIAVHYSQASQQAAYITTCSKTAGPVTETFEPMGGNSALPRSFYDNNRLGMIYALDDIGLQYKFISYKGIEAGELEGGKYKVLLLPYSIAISKKEAEQIKAFVRKGGVVIADALPGLMDNHCAWQGESLLAEVFGLGEKGISKPSDFPDINMVLPAQNVSKTLEGKGAKNNQLIANRYGEGCGIYLNCAFDGYVEALEDNTELKYGKILKPMLGWIGIAPRHEIVFADSGAQVDGCESLWFKDDGSDYLMIIRGTPEMRVHSIVHRYNRKPDEIATPVTVKLCKGGYIYDMRTMRDIGRGAEIKANLPYNGVLMYAVHRMPAPRISVEAKVAEGIARIKFGAESVRPGLSVINLNLMRPGEERKREYDYYMRNVILKNGAGEVDIPMALNDPRGKWQLDGFDVGWGNFIRGHFKF
ncbi:MAG: beta-galactosidase [Verrucomicrobiae bacterium]|nr:beta-galactosidase [Verrucomicrobiae bacterium]